MRTNTHPTHDCPREDREMFVKDNAVSIVDDLEAKILRQRKELHILNSRRKSHEKHINKQNQIILSDKSRIDSLELIGICLLGGFLVSLCSNIVLFTLWVCK